MRHTAREMIRKRYEQMKLKSQPDYSRTTKYVSFEEGDQVLLWDDNIPKGIARKLHPRWIGPFVILRRVSAYVYEILYRGKKKMVHARRLIEYHNYLLEDWETDDQPSSSKDEETKSQRGEDQEQKQQAQDESDLDEISAETEDKQSESEKEEKSADTKSQDQTTAEIDLKRKKNH